MIKGLKNRYNYTFKELRGMTYMTRVKKTVWKYKI